MAIFVDELKLKKRKYYCHMLSDEGLEELHSFAKKLGVKKHWFHNGDHYDLREDERNLALHFGAKKATSRELVMVRRKFREKRNSRRLG